MQQSQWRETVERHHAALIGELTADVNAETESRIADAVTQAVTEAVAQANSDAEKRAAEASAKAADNASQDARRKLSESLNQTLRRIRQTAAEHETLELLLAESTTAAESAVVLLIENGQASIAAWRGIEVTGQDEGDLHFSLDQASAVSACCESRDPVVALADASQISEMLASRVVAGSKVYLFPITARQKTMAVLLAFGEVAPGTIEVLCEAAGLKLEVFEVAPASEPQAEPASLIQIEGVPASLQEVPWSALSTEEQALHLRAQRIARVRVAQIRIDEPDALRNGVQARNIYGALKEFIDQAREEYEHEFLTKSATMVDYLHLEILRSLARNDSGALGAAYPGPVAHV